MKMCGQTFLSALLWASSLVCAFADVPEQKAPEEQAGMNARFCLSAEALEAAIPNGLSGDIMASAAVANHYYLCMFNTEMAKKWILISAENGEAGAMSAIGVIYCEELDTELNRRGLFWLKKASENGVEIASFMLSQYLKLPEKPCGRLLLEQMP
ncbi:MAG TPA: hypothetical protein PK264_00265 [Hyphomicrobiaceae bacterium]|nr:hypothetical protein [Hyphomicrobiaceae bacterium]